MAIMLIWRRVFCCNYWFVFILFRNVLHPILLAKNRRSTNPSLHSVHHTINCTCTCAINATYYGLPLRF